MTLARREMISILKKYALQEYSKKLDEYLSHVDLTDLSPEIGRSHYNWPPEGEESKYCYVETLLKEKEIMIGGRINYWVIHKDTGAISNIAVYEE